MNTFQSRRLIFKQEKCLLHNFAANKEMQKKTKRKMKQKKVKKKVIKNGKYHVNEDEHDVKNEGEDDLLFKMNKMWNEIVIGWDRLTK